MTNEEATIILLNFVEHIYGHVVGVDVKLEEAIEMARDALTKRDNSPLTLEQLKQMDGEPVYLTWDNKGWGVVAVLDGEMVVMIPENDGHHYICTAYSPSDADGISYVYAHKPETEAMP